MNNQITMQTEVVGGYAASTFYKVYLGEDKPRTGLLEFCINAKWCYLHLADGLKNKKRIWLDAKDKDEAFLELKKILEPKIFMNTIIL